MRLAAKSAELASGTMLRRLKMGRQVSPVPLPHHPAFCLLPLRMPGGLGTAKTCHPLGCLCVFKNHVDYLCWPPVADDIPFLVPLPTSVLRIHSGLLQPACPEMNCCRSSPWPQEGCTEDPALAQQPAPPPWRAQCLASPQPPFIWRRGMTPLPEEQEALLATLLQLERSVLARNTAQPRGPYSRGL